MPNTKNVPLRAHFWYLKGVVGWISAKHQKCAPKGMFLVFEGGGKGENTRDAVFLVFHMKGETVSHTKFVS